MDQLDQDIGYLRHEELEKLPSLTLEEARELIASRLIKVFQAQSMDALDSIELEANQLIEQANQLRECLVDFRNRAASLGIAPYKNLLPLVEVDTQLKTEWGPLDLEERVEAVIHRLHPEWLEKVETPYPIHELRMNGEGIVERDASVKTALEELAPNIEEGIHAIKVISEYNYYRFKEAPKIWVSHSPEVLSSQLEEYLKTHPEANSQA